MSLDDANAGPLDAPRARPLSQTSAPSAPADPVEKAPFFRDPAFQEFYRNAQAQGEVLEELRRVFAEGRYSINSVSTLCGVHEDAFFLYDIVGGKRRLSELLAVIEKGVPAQRGRPRSAAVRARPAEPPEAPRERAGAARGAGLEALARRKLPRARNPEAPGRLAG